MSAGPSNPKREKRNYVKINTFKENVVECFEKIIKNTQEKFIIVHKNDLLNDPDQIIYDLLDITTTGQYPLNTTTTTFPVTLSNRLIASVTGLSMQKHDMKDAIFNCHNLLIDFNKKPSAMVLLLVLFYFSGNKVYGKTRDHSPKSVDPEIYYKTKMQLFYLFFKRIIKYYKTISEDPLFFFVYNFSEFADKRLRDEIFKVIKDRFKQNRNLNITTRPDNFNKNIDISLHKSTAKKPSRIIKKNLDNLDNSPNYVYVPYNPKRAKVDANQVYSLEENHNFQQQKPEQYQNSHSTMHSAFPETNQNQIFNAEPVNLAEFFSQFYNKTY